MRKKLKFITYGNCQAWPLGRLLAESEFGRQYLENVPVMSVHLLAPEDKDLLYKNVADTDIFIFQPVSSAYGDFSTALLLDLLKPGAIKLSIPVCYFRAYNPELIYLPGGDKVSRNHRLFAYHNIHLLRSYCKGGSLDQAAGDIMNRQLVSYETIIHCFNTDIGELARREQQLDISISDFIAENWTQTRLFFTFNHCCTRVLRVIANRVIGRLGGNDLISESEESRLGEPLGAFVPPMYQAVYRKLWFPEEPNRFDVKFSSETLPFLEYAKRAYYLYQANDTAIKNSFHLLESSTDDVIRSLAKPSPAAIISSEPNGKRV